MKSTNVASKVMNRVTPSRWLIDLTAAARLDSRTNGCIRPAKRLGGPPRTVHWRFEHGQRAGKLFPPVGHVLCEGRWRDYATLPFGIVCILDGQLRHGRRLASSKSFVQSGQLRQKHPVNSDAVKDDMTEREKQAMLCVP